MAIVISKMKVESFDKWCQAWDASRAVRSTSGMKSATVLRDPGAPTALTIITRWDTAAQATSSRSRTPESRPTLRSAPRPYGRCTKRQRRRRTETKEGRGVIRGPFFGSSVEGKSNPQQQV